MIGVIFIKWLKVSDYISIISKFTLLYLLELLFIDDVIIKIFFLICNIFLIYLSLYLTNIKIENHLKRVAKKQHFIDEEYKKLDEEKESTENNA